MNFCRLLFLQSNQSWQLLLLPIYIPSLIFEITSPAAFISDASDTSFSERTSLFMLLSTSIGTALKYLLQTLRILEASLPSWVVGINPLTPRNQPQCLMG